MIAKYLLLLCTVVLVYGAVRVNKDPSQAAAICAAPGSDSILIAHEKCDKFYKCSQGVPVAIDCPVPLLYDPDKEWCDWPENVNCNGQVDEERKEDQVNGSVGNVGNDSKTVEEICTAEGSHGLLLPHEVCRKFYICAFGRPFAYDCQAPTVYNMKKKYCDWRQNVDCENRI